MKLPSATRLAGAVGAVLLITVLGASAAAAAVGTPAPDAKARVGHITVSNPTPTRQSEIDVRSAGGVRAGPSRSCCPASSCGASAPTSTAA